MTESITQVNTLALAIAASGGGDGGAVNRAETIKAYEKELRSAWQCALVVSSVHACSRFLSKCNLVCATVVLLGAFAQFLVPVDFNSVVILLLLDSARLACASFFAQIYRRALANLSQDPKSIKHSEDEHYRRAWWARLFSLFPMIAYIVSGFCISGPQIISTKQDVYKSVDHARNLQKSLHIFYISAFVNSILALVPLICSAGTSFRAFYGTSPSTEQSILRYYDKLVENAMASGVMQANNFEFFRFAFEMLAAEFGRNVQAEAVARNHKQLIHYMYAHRVGVDFVQIYLNAEDAYQQLAAVNVVGFWADRAWGVGVPQLRLPEELLTELADKVGTGQVGWAATSSIGAIAASSPQGAEMVERTCTSKGVRLADRLAQLVDDSSSRSLSLVRTLVVFYEQLCVGKSEAPAPFTNGREFTCKLVKLAGGARRHRLRVQAAYLLRLMNQDCDASDIRRIDPTRDDYWFQSEMRMLRFLRQTIDEEPFEFHDPQRPHVRDDRRFIFPPKWA